MTTMAEVIADELDSIILRRYGITSDTSTYQEMGEELAEELGHYGFGHVPTALNEAADAIDQLPPHVTPGRLPEILAYDDGREDGRDDAAEHLRTRAAETGADE